ncbi:mercuric transporter MerT family protein [Cytophaga sp. FL35]|uniref:mercuric transporter MerT family protein n=1 Tax=Cytophaga sp. FL35 TaxID=1904456 RepID=UPI001653905A|nr:mercuric transporter MerT family protein [Cytophaga sp. FL35]MBC6999597.1 hypothetical protein [Cytophaga sp. FL35]
MKAIVKMVLGTSLVAATLPLMCCLAPTLLSVVAGLGFLGGNFDWVHPVQPYLTTFSVGALGFAHFKNGKNSKKCDGDSCQNEMAKHHINSWTLWIVTSLVIIITITNYWYEF